MTINTTGHKYIGPYSEGFLRSLYSQALLDNENSNQEIAASYGMAVGLAAGTKSNPKLSKSDQKKLDKTVKDVAKKCLKNGYTTDQFLKVLRKEMSPIKQSNYCVMVVAAIAAVGIAFAFANQYNS